MRASRSAAAGLTGVMALASWVVLSAGQAGQLPLEPLGSRGEAVFPYLEGWFPNPDGTFAILFGYNNRNSKQSFDIPVGPNNKIEPNPIDQGQPTHFLPNRNNRMFTITVPKDFGTKKVTWTLTANGITQSVSAWLNPPYFVEPLLNTGTGNTPPVIKIGDGREHTGPPAGIYATLAAVVGQPLTLSVWAMDKGNTIVLDPNPPARGAGGRGRGGRGAADDAASGGRGRGGRGGGPPAVVNIRWDKYRGAGEAKIADETLPITDAAGQTVATTATFAAAGEYWLRVQANEGAGEGGSGQCCSTAAIVKVNVKGAGG
jgi:hypothetical protein